MRICEVIEVHKEKNIIEYKFEVLGDLKKYFSEYPFVIEYPEDIELVPDSIAIIPFVCNILPIIWLTDSKLVLKELDEAFWECIPEVKKGYETMFPESDFKGEILVKKIVPCNVEKTTKEAMFYSGGLDSIQTLISHLDEKPDLISIWGSDIKYDNAEGWKIVHSAVEEAAEKYGLKEVVIHSSFREFDNEGRLYKDFATQLKDGWWHGVKHGIGLLGHVAPYAYLHGVSTMYIASTNCPADGQVRCASNPIIDNYVRYATCKVVHDGFEYSRQDKVHNVVEFCNKNNVRVNLHVCWVSQKGSNCCMCEKCYRTIVGLIAEGADPKEYGFEKVDLYGIQEKLLVQKMMSVSASQKHWTKIRNAIINNKKELKQTKYWEDIRWILKADFMHPETIKMPLEYRIRQRIYANPLYQFAHKIKVRIKNGKR